MKRRREIDKWINQEQGNHFCQCGCGEEIKIQHYHRWYGIPKFICGHNKARLNIPHSKDTIFKLRKITTELWKQLEFREKTTKAHIGVPLSGIHKERISQGNRGKPKKNKGEANPEAKKRMLQLWQNPDYREQICKAHIGSMRGEKSPHWKGGTSFEPYCHKFNNAFKETIREDFGRKCFLCNKTEKENRKKLSIHHINYDKNQGCEDKKWLLVPLCHSCHSKTNHNRKYWEGLILAK